MNAGTLEVDIAVGIARLQQELQQANGMFASTFGGINSMAANTNKVLAGLGVTLSAGFFAGLVKGSIDAMDHLNDLSKVTRVSAEDLSGLGFAARMSGGDLESAAGALTKLTMNMGKGAEKFGALGVSARDPIAALKQLADVTNALEDPQMRAAVLSEALGKSWQQVAPLLAEGSAKIGEMVDRGKQLSGVTEANVKLADELNDKLIELVGNGGALNATVGASLPILNALADGLLRWKKEGDGVTTGSVALAEALRAIVVFGGNVAFVFKGIGTEIGGIAAQIGALYTLAPAMRAASKEGNRFAEISRQMKEDAEKARTDFDKWEASIMAIGTTAKSTTSALDSMDQVQRRMAQEAAAAAREFLEHEKRKKEAEDAARKAAAERKALLDADLRNYIASLEAQEKQNDETQTAISNAIVKAGEDRKKLYEQDARNYIESLEAQMKADDEMQTAISNAMVKAGEERKAAFQKSFQESFGQASDIAGTFFSDLIFDGDNAFDHLKQNVKHLLADMVALFAKRWILNMAAGDGAGAALMGAFTGGGAATAAGGGGLAGMAGMSPAMYALGAIPVAGWIALAIGALAYHFRDRGENWQGQLGFGPNAHAYTSSGPFGTEGFNFVQGQDATNRAMQAFFASTGGLDRQIAGGLTAEQIARITGNLGGPYGTRADGQPSTFAFGEGDSTAAQQFTLEYLKKKYGTIFDEIDKTFADFIRSYTGDSGELLSAIADFAAVMDALQGSPIPGLDIEALRALQQEGEKLTDTFNRVASAWSNYVSLFYSESEQHAMGMDMLRRQFEALGVVMPTTREGFRALVESLEPGSPLWLAVIGMAGMFSDLVPAIDAVTQAGRRPYIGHEAPSNGTGYGPGGSPSGGTTNTGGSDIPYGGMYGPGGSAYGGGGGYGPGPGEAPGSPSDLTGWLAGALGGNNLSPLPPEQQLEVLRQAWMANPTAATSNAYLGLARQLYGSSSAYTSLFHEVYDANAGVVGAADYNTRMEQLQQSHLSTAQQGVQTLTQIAHAIDQTNTILQTIVDGAGGGGTGPAATLELR